MDKKKYEALFFDFDGVIVDSVEIKSKAFELLFKEYSKDIVKKIVKHHRENGGMPRKDKFIFYYKEFLKKTLTSYELENLCKKFSRVVVEKIIEAPEIVGFSDFIKKWSSEVKCFIVSAAPIDELLRIVIERDIKKYFIEILGSQKTKQENLKYLIEKYRIDSSKALFFGDAINDYVAAKESRVNFIGILPNIDSALLKLHPNIEWQKDFFNIERFF